MDKTILVRMTGADGQPFPEHLLTSLYASDPHFEPDARRLSVTSDGECELVVTANPFYLHARVDLPQYGNIWVMADNGGAVFRDGPVDFVRAAVETYRREAARLYAEAGTDPSVPVAAHMAAAEEYDRLADAGADPGYCRLKALSHAVMAAEDALFETSSDRLAGKGRPDLLLGCNLFKYPGPSRFEDYFLDTFNFATLPFYHNQVAPTEHGPLDFARRDELAGWCADHGVVAKGHPLWFGHGDTNPGWMTGKSYAELSVFARKTAKECVSCYRGRVTVWDAINEPHDWANCFGFTQPELLDLAHVCCNAVREADPGVTSLINVCLPFAEYVAGRFNRWGPVQDRPMSPLRYLENAIDDGVDFDAVGVQLYFPARDMLAVSRILDEFARFGKPVHITEMGVCPAGRSNTLPTPPAPHPPRRPPRSRRAPDTAYGTPTRRWQTPRARSA